MNNNIKSFDLRIVEFLKERLVKEDTLIFHVKTSKKENKILYGPSQEIFILEIKGKPIEGKANKEIVSILHMLTKKKVQIISGLKSKTKKIKFS
jgi:uncharacterized protein YggU (UPF0235/DUF167 family)